MKTIVIHPEIIGFDNTGVREPKNPLNRTAALTFVLIPVVAFSGWAVGRGSVPPTSNKAAAHTAEKSAPAAVPVAVKRSAPAIPEGAVDLQTALDAGLINAEFMGNGREQMRATLTNQQAKALTVNVSFGQMFESGRNLVVTVRNASIELPPKQSAKLGIQTAATRSANQFGPANFRLSPKTTPKIDLLLSYAQDHPELSLGALQTAMLALTENLPLSAVCQFTPAGGDLPSRFDTTIFRVETADILSALSTLREIGVRDRDLALTIDPQLKLEAMIEPLLRAPAMRYYGIAADQEWEFWKNELLAGENGTRHYALFGIARFFPETAVTMLPKWVREKRTNSSFRLAAVQALANTHRADALPILRKLVAELGRNTELGRAALDAAEYLDRELTKAASIPDKVAFRGGAVTSAEL